MKLNPEQKARLFKKLQNPDWEFNCPVCNTSKWNTSDTVFEMREFVGSGAVAGSIQVYPVIPVSCANCGNTIFLNAITMGCL